MISIKSVTELSHDYFASSCHSFTPVSPFKTGFQRFKADVSILNAYGTTIHVYISPPVMPKHTYGRWSLATCIGQPARL